MRRTGIMKAIILAGGKGTRLEPYTTVFPKPMLPVGDKPILDIVIQQLSHYGVKEIILSVGYLAELIQAYYNQNNPPNDVSLSYVKEKRPLGTAGSLSLMSDLTETFLVMNGDVLTSLDYRNLFKFHKKNKGIMTIAMHKRKVDIDFGVISTDEKYRLTGYDEKPMLDYLVSMGIYVFEPEVLTYISKNKKLDLPDLVKRLLDAGEKVQGYPYGGYWLDIGRHDDYEAAVKGFDKMKRTLLK
jgi:NDP-sugar pyrophosphorylase family protein